MQTVLVVDDDRTVREMITQAIGEPNLEVVSASDAANGLELLAKRKFQVDVCLLDIMLPDISGLDAFEEFHRDAKLPIIFITGDSSSGTAIGR
jgi:DNA-binding response OmpR family regulator